jgi:SEC-C motif-containing protein
MSLCPCGSQNTYESCCGLYLDKQQRPATPEQLMRSRYTAYSLSKIDYIKNTMKDDALIGFNEQQAMQWSQRVTWLKLEVINSNMSGADCGFVEFAATYLEQQQVKIIHEVSEFHKQNDAWFYIKGIHQQSLEKKKSFKVARNASCPCGSGKKFKNCHAI